MIVSETTTAPSTPAPAGTHTARCVSVIDLGTQHWEYQGQPKAARKVRLTFELPEELHVFDEAKGDQPFFVSAEFTASLHEKANLRHYLESWRGRPFTPAELAGFDLKNLLGVPAMVTVVHAERSGKTYANITGIAALPKKLVCPPAISPLVYLGFESWDEAVYAALPQWLRTKIASSDEFKRREHADEPPTPSEPQAPDEDNDPLPF